jgi:hypothetical protein
MSDPLLDRILYDCRMSGGTMPIRIAVKDEAEKSRGLALIKGRHNNKTISFVTEAELAAEIAVQLGRWDKERRRELARRERAP